MSAYDYLESSPEDGERYYVYALIDPRCNAVRYIGLTTNVVRRVSGHLSSATNPALGAWLDELRSLGMSPRVQTLADAYGARAGCSMETVYIDEYQRFQGGLLNQIFDLARERKLEYDRAARVWMRELITNARKNSGHRSRIAKQCVQKRRKKSPTRITFDVA